MKHASVLTLLLVLLLAACQAKPTPTPAPLQVQPPTAAPAQAQPTQVQVKPTPTPARATAQPTQVQQQEEPASAPAAPELLDEALGQKLQAALDAAMNSPDTETEWVGAVLYVHAPGLGAWSGAAGLGEIATNTPMRPHDRFRGGSLTKPFIATVVLQLVEEGRFSLDDPIAKVLPAGAAGKVPNSDRITVRMLLNQTSGVPEFSDAAAPEEIAHPDKVWTAEEFLDFAAAQKPQFAPGEHQRYTNTNYLLLGMIIEKATGRPWRQEVRQRIFEPLNLKDTLLPAPEDKTLPGDHAHGYADFGQGMVDATELVTASVVGAAGGQSLVTNAPDLATFMEALLAGRLFKKAGTLDQMLSFVEFSPDQPEAVVVKEYGLGLMKVNYGDDLTGIGHAGDTEGYHGFVFHYPDQEITISGAVNVKDSGAGYLNLMPPVLQLLVPGHTMPELPNVEQAVAGAALQGLLDDQVREQGISGMIMAARLPDGWVVSRSSGYADPVKKTPWTTDTVSALGSVTKSFTAVVIMQLVQEGKLSLDDTIDTWFPDQPNGEVITVRMLLSHTSGLGGFIPAGNEKDPKWSKVWAPMDLVAEANRLGPVDKPGGSAHYSNTNYMLLGMIVEKITGNSLHEEFRSRIFEPLHLEHTAFLGDKGLWGGILAPGYTKTADGLASVLEMPSLPDPSIAWAVGDVVTSPADLLTFATALFDGKLVSEESLAEMATPVAKDAGDGQLWGLGGGTLEGVPGGFGMGGEAVGYKAFYLGVQGTKIVVLALANTWEADVIGPSLMAFDYVRSLQPGGGQPAPGGAEAPAIPPDLVNRAAGWLAKELNVSVKDLRLVSAEHVEWTDSCFGLGGPAESCLQAITPGWRMVAEAGGKQYEVRTDEAGSSFRLAPQGS